MFDISEIAEKGDFIYWFKRQHIISDTWEVYQNTSEGNQYNLVALYDEECDEFNIMGDLCQLSPDVEEKIKTNFLLYKESRPEYHVGKPIRFDISTSTQDLGHKYDAILAGAILSQANSDNVIPKIDKCLKWLHSTDFYVAPGSTIYHNSELSGLLVHSLQVYNKLLEIAILPSFSSVNIFEAIIVALSHDWCKIELYEKYMRNVKDETTGAWKAVPSFRRLPPKLPFGHGVSSLFIAQKFFNVSTEMALAIRWHMGRWNVVDSEVNDLQYANENYPLVHLIQFADQLSIVNYN